MLTTANLTTNPVLINTIIANIEKASAFQRASVQIPLDGNGSIIPFIGQADASWVAEAALKPSADATIDEVEIVAKKLARTVTWSMELEDDHPTVVNAITVEAIGSLARSFDRTIAGLQAAPSGFDQLSVGTDNVTVTSYQEFRAAIAPVAEDPASAIVLNTQLISELFGVVHPTTGLPVFNIVGDYTTGGTINGIPYYVFGKGGTSPLGFVGPFATRAVYGIIPGSVKVIPLTEAATVNGVLIGLKEHNLKGAIVEGRYGFKVYSKDEFKNITTGITV